LEIVAVFIVRGHIVLISLCSIIAIQCVL